MSGSPWRHDSGSPVVGDALTKVVPGCDLKDNGTWTSPFPITFNKQLHREIHCLQRRSRDSN